MAKPNYRQKVEVLIIKDGKVCVCTPSASRSHYNFPGGGVDQGESFDKAAARESLEEVGIVVANVTNMNAGDIFKTGTKATKLGYDGSQVSYYLAAYAWEDKRTYNIEGDGRSFEWMDLDKAIGIYRAANSEFDDSRAAALTLAKTKFSSFLKSH